MSGTPQQVNSITGEAMLMGADFSLDGKNDLIMATDGNSGQVYYFKNNGTSTPFSAGVTQILTETFNDFDTGFLFNYDNDPDGSMDLMLADGNGTGYATFANRVLATFVACGDIASGVLDLGDLSDEEMVVTAARISPTMVVPAGTSITFYMSNEDPADWQPATQCVDDATDYCVSFPHPVGRSVRWKATMCSNTTRTITPSITEIEINYDYTLAEEHFRGGVVVDDGVAYVGAFRQPGDRGHFYAANAGLTEVYWDAGAKLDATADSDRKMYTSTADGADRLDFTSSAATSSAPLRETLGVASAAQAQEVIAWQRSARFGIEGGGNVKTRLGAVETSTPAVISPPDRPLWYPYLSTQAKQEVDAYIHKHKDRPVLALFGSKDGPLHAVRNEPNDIEDTRNGTEAWAFIPAKVASRFVANKASGTVTSFVNGSPTLVDVRLSDGKLHTVALVSGGNGSSSVFALDVTDTVNPASGAVTGPEPLWHALPGDELAGQGRAKPAAARVRIGGSEKYIAILATGLARDNPSPPYSKGRDVVAIDIATGQRMWRFRTACPVTSDPVVFETDDEAEPGDPQLDGYVDRLILADACGFVYKVDPGVSLPGAGATDGWLDTSTLGVVVDRHDRCGRPRGQGAVLHPLHQRRDRRRAAHRRHRRHPHRRDRPRGAVLRHRRSGELRPGPAQRVLRRLRRQRRRAQQADRRLHRRPVREVLRRRGGVHRPGAADPRHGSADRHRHVRDGQLGGDRRRPGRPVARAGRDHRLGHCVRAVRPRRRGLLHHPGGRPGARRHAGGLGGRRRVGRRRR